MIAFSFSIYRFSLPTQHLLQWVLNLQYIFFAYFAMIVLFAPVYFPRMQLASGWIHSGIEISTCQFCYANSPFKIYYYFWNMQFFAVYQLAIHIARHPSSWRWEGNTPGMRLWALTQNFCFEESHVSSRKSDGEKLVKMSKRENWCQVSSASPYWQKMWAPATH